MNYFLEISFAPSSDFKPKELYPSDPFSCVIEYFTNGIKYNFDATNDGDNSGNVIFGPVIISDDEEEISTVSFQTHRKKSKTQMKSSDGIHAKHAGGNLCKCLEYMNKRKNVQEFYFDGGDAKLQELYASSGFIRNVERQFPAFIYSKSTSKGVSFVRRQKS